MLEVVGKEPLLLVECALPLEAGVRVPSSGPGGEHVGALGASFDLRNNAPAVHRVVSLAKRWLLGTHQGSVEPAHLASYLNEFVFRFNRRRSRSRGMVFYRVLELAVAHDPVRYQDLIATSRPRAVRLTPPYVRGQPPNLERPPANRPWKIAALNWSG